VAPLDVFNPVDLSDASRLTEPAGARALLDAARSFPGGPAMLVFALFWSPVGPGIPAGVLLARHIPLSPPITFALLCRLRPPRRTGLLSALHRAPAPRAAEVQAELCRRGVGPPLFRIATMGFGVDVYSAGMVATGLPVPRTLGWGSAIAGDLVWFTLLFGTSMAAGAAVDDDRVVALVVLVAMFVIPALARRVFPALR
jgi:hypothetical protein